MTRTMSIPGEEPTTTLNEFPTRPIQGLTTSPIALDCNTPAQRACALRSLVPKKSGQEAKVLKVRNTKRRSRL